MTRQIIEDGKILVNTFWNSREECVQFTTPCDYVQMPRDEAIRFLERAARKLRRQRAADKLEPPWWQSFAKEAAIR